MSPYELWETKCSESNFISTHHWHATFRACKTIFHEKLDLWKMHTMMHIQTFWKITGVSFKLHDSEYIISWPLHDFSFTLYEKIALKSRENKIKICRYLINLDNWVFFQSANSNCCKKIWIDLSWHIWNRQFSRCQVFPKHYLQRPTAMVDRRNTGKFYGSFHSKFLPTLGPKSV